MSKNNVRAIFFFIFIGLFSNLSFKNIGNSRTLVYMEIAWLL